MRTIYPDHPHFNSQVEHAKTYFLGGVHKFYDKNIIRYVYVTPYGLCFFYNTTLEGVPVSISW